MLYAIAHFLRDKLPWIWDMIDLLNSWLFGLRFDKKLGHVQPQVLEKYSKECGMRIVPMREVDSDALVAFFAAQPEEAFTFFKPHGFDAKALRKLQRNKSFLGYVLIDASSKGLISSKSLKGGFSNPFNPSNSSNPSTPLKSFNTPAIAGYCFIRSFFMGKGFRGRMVGISHRGRGLGTLMNRMMNEVGFGIGLRLFETVSKRNVASYRSAMSASNVKVLEEMEDDELYLEILKD